MKNTPLTLLARLLKFLTPGANPLRNSNCIPVYLSADGTTFIADEDLLRYLQSAMKKEFAS